MKNQRNVINFSDSLSVERITELTGLVADAGDSLTLEALESQTDVSLPTLVVCLQGGQSLDVNRKVDGPVSTILTPSKGLMPNGGFQNGEQSDWQASANVQSSINFEDLVPYVNGTDGEGWALGSIEQHGKFDGVKKVAHYSGAYGGHDWEKTGPGSGIYGTNLRYLQLAYDYAKLHGLNVRVHIRRSQGEADSDTIAAGGGTSESPVTQAQWESGTREMVTGYTDDWNIICNGEFPPPVFVDSILNSAGSYGGGFAVNAAQLKMAQEGVVMLAPARYQFPDYWVGDLIHPTPLQYRLHAECVSLIEIDALFGKTFMPLHVVSQSRAGTVITLGLSQPSVVDETRVTTPDIYPDGKRGIHVFQSDGTEVVVNSADLTDNQTITVTCATDPDAGCYVRIAQQDPLVATRPLTYLQRANFHAIDEIGQSIHLVDGSPFIFRNYIMQQRVDL